MANLTEESRAQRDYHRGIRAAFRGFWVGVFDADAFIDTMVHTIRRGLRRAWTEGMKACGLKIEEISPSEQAKLEQIIAQEYMHLLSVAAWLDGQTKAQGKKLAPLLSRADLWINRYNEVVSIAKTMACGDKKFKWILGPTEHCKSCAGFHGRVYRGSVWAANGAHPQSRLLCCRGYRCQCQLVPTTDKITPGRFPKSLLCG